MTATPTSDVAATPLHSDLGTANSTDYLRVQYDFTPEQLEHLLRVRDFVDHEVVPVISDYWERAEFPRELVARLGELGIIGDVISGYGCPGLDATAAGLVQMELSRGDGSLGTFFGVHSGLAMHSIAQCGSEEQKQRWLPAMARLEKIGCFALTEPDHGSDSVALETSATRSGDEWVLSGTKRWIGNGSIADVAVVWARDTADDRVKGFLVELPAAGYRAELITGKGALRAVWQAEITLDDVVVPEANRLPGARSFADCAKILVNTRTSCAWMALGHATAGYETALRYAQRRTQFGKSLASFQIVQQRLVRMLADLTAMQLYCVQIATLQARGKLSPTLAGLAKLHNTTKARVILADARDLLGGNGILLDYQVMRHLNDIEAVHTFEGTETMQTLIVGRDITGVGAFT